MDHQSLLKQVGEEIGVVSLNTPLKRGANLMVPLANGLHQTII
jgi:hypothetical protein